jgi:V8-like Glu-specific endopeptidase
MSGADQQLPPQTLSEAWNSSESDLAPEVFSKRFTGFSDPFKSTFGFVPAERRKPIGRNDPVRLSVVQLLAFAPGERRPRKAGTGLVIGRDMLLTAAHVIFDPRPTAFGTGRSGYAAGVTLTSAFLPRLGRADSSTRFIVPPGWRTAKMRSADLGVIRLPAPLPVEAVPVVPQALSNQELRGEAIRVYGYPELENALFFGRGRCVLTDDGILYHTGDATEGQSGGGVFCAPGEGLVLTGVHRAGPEETPSTVPPSCSAVHFTPESIAGIRKMESLL